MVETRYLLSSLKNTEHIRQALKKLEKGKQLRESAHRGLSTFQY